MASYVPAYNTHRQLIVGSEDFKMRIKYTGITVHEFLVAEMIHEVHEL